MDLRSFFRTVITTETGWFCLAFRSHDTRWTEEFYKWPQSLDKIISRVNTLKQANKYDVYFSPYLFNTRSSIKDQVLPSRTIVADLDEANPLFIQHQPSVLVETSPKRYQGYWILNSALPLYEHESLSKRLTYSIEKCDISGWFLGKKVRVPTTHNFKYTDLFEVAISKQQKTTQTRLYKAADFDDLGTAIPINTEPVVVSDDDQEWIQEGLKLGTPQELLSKLRGSVRARVITEYSKASKDRSASLWHLMNEAFRFGYNRQQVLCLAYNSANNKFKDLRSGGIQELAKDVLRAQAAYQGIPDSDIKDRVNKARMASGVAHQKSAGIANLVYNYLLSMGEFHHAIDETFWYIREDEGRPIQLSIRSEQAKTLLDTMFDINSTDQLSQFILSHLITKAAHLPAISRMAALSHYDQHTRTLLLHTGGRTVLQITHNSIVEVQNGYQSTIFPWARAERLRPIPNQLSSDWADIMFDDCLGNVVGIPPTYVKVLLKVWFVSVILRHGIQSRPILALVGSPGSGKSTLFRKIYTLIYGSQKALNAVTTPDDFDHATANNPLVVLDNVDTWERWLPDRLALSAASSEIVKRKLYTDTDIITLHRQAMLGLTAHNPKFGREDVVDRLILLTFERLQQFKPETDILDNIMLHRNELWGDILTDIQQILKTDFPTNGYPQFRVEDFARFGFWIAQGLHIGTEFAAALDTIRSGQKLFVLEEDSILVEVISEYIERQKRHQQAQNGVASNTATTTTPIPMYKTVGQWWMTFCAVAKDPLTFQRKYTNAVQLGKKLWVLQDALRELFDVTWKPDPRGTRVWCFASATTPTPTLPSKDMSNARD